jgi:micrococcal nuclease
MQLGSHTRAAIWVFVMSVAAACSATDAADESGEETTGQVSPCGPNEGIVSYVVDGDTVEMLDGTRVRYLLIDTPEVSPPEDCWGPEATNYNRELVEGKTVQLSYDEACQDQYGRTLAYLSVDGVEVNSRLVERGHACVLHIPPNGNDRVLEFMNLQAIAESESRGMWGACADPCP